MKKVEKQQTKGVLHKIIGGRNLTMRQIANETGWSKSRLSHALIDAEASSELISSVDVNPEWAPGMAGHGQRVMVKFYKANPEWEMPSSYTYKMAEKNKIDKAVALLEENGYMVTPPRGKG